MRRIVFMVLALFAVTVTVGASAAEKIRIADTGETTLQMRHGGRSITISINTYRRRAALSPDEHDSTAPERPVVERIAITVDKRDVYVPRSVVSALILPRDAELRMGSPISVLRIDGGDASEAYIVRIEFDSQRVRRMTVASAFIPDKPTQVTNYYLRESKN